MWILRSGISLVCALWVAWTPALSRADAAKEGIARAKFARLFVDGPVSVSAFNTPIGFHEELSKLDTQGVMYDFDQPWQPFFERDVWVFLLTHDQGADVLGGMPKNVFDALGAIDDSTISRGGLVTLTPDGAEPRRVFVQFVYANKLTWQTERELACKVAAQLHLSLVVASDARSKVADRVCENRS